MAYGKCARCSWSAPVGEVTSQGWSEAPLRRRRSLVSCVGEVMAGSVASGSRRRRGVTLHCLAPTKKQKRAPESAPLPPPAAPTPAPALDAAAAAHDGPDEVEMENGCPEEEANLADAASNLRRATESLERLREEETEELSSRAWMNSRLVALLPAGWKRRWMRLSEEQQAQEVFDASVAFLAYCIQRARCPINSEDAMEQR